jgi:hypothetical protein
MSWQKQSIPRRVIALVQRSKPLEQGFSSYMCAHDPLPLLKHQSVIMIDQLDDHLSLQVLRWLTLLAYLRVNSLFSVGNHPHNVGSSSPDGGTCALCFTGLNKTTTNRRLNISPFLVPYLNNIWDPQWHCSIISWPAAPPLDCLYVLDPWPPIGKCRV